VGRLPVNVPETAGGDGVRIIDSCSQDDFSAVVQACPSADTASLTLDTGRSDRSRGHRASMVDGRMFE